MKQYSHLLIDLDHTLWDFDANCRETLEMLYNSYKLRSKGINSVNTFFKQYLKVNNKQWSLYNENKITKEEIREQRFVEVLGYFGVQDKQLALELEDKYLDICPKNGLLVDGARAFLEHVKNDFELIIITNGFNVTQGIKMDCSNISNYFSTVFTSESTGFKKPDPRFFEHVLHELGVSKEDCLVIGDNPNSDIHGANRMQIHSCWINTQGYKKRMSSTYYVDTMHELIKLF